MCANPKGERNHADFAPATAKRKALRALEESATSSGIAAADREKAAARLVLRGQTDCQGPRRAIPPAGPSRRPAAAKA